jgi:hypothetical protein
VAAAALDAQQQEAVAQEPQAQQREATAAVAQDAQQQAEVMPEHSLATPAAV